MVKIWLRLNKLIKPNGVIVLFGGESFSSLLRTSNIKDYRYDIIWQKEKPTNAFTVKNNLVEYMKIYQFFIRKLLHTIRK